jgi:hypothetical protein
VTVPLGQERAPASRLLAGLPDSFVYEHLTPERVADLLRAVVALLPDRAAFDAVEERLLDVTLRYAATYSPHYRRVLPPALSGPGGHRFTRRDLALLPVLRRSDLTSRATAMRCEIGDYAASVFTTGTTSGRQAIIDRSAQEMAWLRRFFIRQTRTGNDAGPAVTLVLANLAHGGPHTLPTGGVQVPVAVTDEQDLATALALLRRDYRVGGTVHRVNAVGGHKLDLLTFTDFLRHTDPDAVAPVTYLQSTGDLLLHREQRMLADFWRARVADRFGTSEVMVGAWNCTMCGAHHLEPYGLAEVLEFDRDLPAGEDHGRLVLTGFLPFTQLTPILRYDTGDLARVREAGCPVGLPSIELLGRVERSIIQATAGAPSRVIGERHLRDVLSATAGIHLQLTRRGLPDRLRRVDCRVDYTVTADAGHPRLTIPVTFDPTADSGMTAATIRTIRDSLATLTGTCSADWFDIDLRRCSGETAATAP